MGAIRKISSADFERKVDAPEISISEKIAQKVGIHGSCFLKSYFDPATPGQPTILVLDEH